MFENISLAKNGVKNNMTIPNHYVPILKWKRAEQSALQELGDKEKNGLTPLIELVMPTVPLYKNVGKKGEKKTIKKTQEEVFAEVVQKFKERKIKEIPEEILQSWGTKPIFLDFTLLYNGIQLKIDSLSEIASAGADKGLKIIPVLNLNDDSKIKEVIALHSQKYDHGICLRVTPSDLANIETLNKKIETLLKDFNLSRKNIDLLIDIKEIKENGGQYLHFMNASQGIENLSEWRKYIFASGAFPDNMSECRLDEPTFLPRFDWKNWLSLTKEKLARNPIFADYTIRNPIFREALQYYQPTPSIKYTLKNDWLIMKGEMRKNYHYLTNAKLLVEDTEYYFGDKFSWGDKKIAEKAKYYYQYMKDIKKGKIKEGEGKGTGRHTDWIAWGISHHLTSVINQIANLP
jgi:hypothetical protein